MVVADKLSRSLMYSGNISLRVFSMMFSMMLLTLLLMLFAINCKADEKGIVIVANPSVLVSEISRGDIRRIYFGKMKKWPNGMRIKAAQIKNGVLPEIFSSELMRKRLKKYKLYWKRVIAAGTGIPPRSFGSQEEMLEYIKSTEGAIGYIGALSDTTGVVILKVTN